MLKVVTKSSVAMVFDRSQVFITAIKKVKIAESEGCGTTFMSLGRRGGGCEEGVHLF